MRLSDADIEREIAAGRIVVSPFDPAMFGACSIDLRLGARFRRFKAGAAGARVRIGPRGVSPPADDLMEEVEVPPGMAYSLPPGGFALGCTVETVHVPVDLKATLDGRSTLARLALGVHMTAHTVHPGWPGRTLVLEFINAGPLVLELEPGARICAIDFERLSSASTRPYGSSPGAKYADQEGPAAGSSRPEGRP
jgi:dCTP deaminase